jgi:protein ImuB
MGQPGLLLQRIARGEETRLFAGYRPAQHFEKSLDLDWNLDSLEPLLFVLGSLLEALCEQLKSSALAAEKIHISLQLEDGSVHERSLQLAIPMNNPRVLLSLLRLDLQEHSPHQSICAVTVRADPTYTRVIQHSLLQPTNANPEKLSRTLARLNVLVGEKNIGYPILLDTHRPDAVKLGLLPLEHARSRQNAGQKEKQVGQLRPPLQLALRRIRPPEPIHITSQQLLYCAGPWRSCGDWWVENNADGWSRDEWDIETNEGEIYRIFWDHGKKNWFVEGVYD